LLFVEVGSFCPLRENFRLTPEVKEKFTKKLRLDPQSFSGRRVTGVVRKRRFEAGARRWFRVCCRLSGIARGSHLFESAQPARVAELSAAANQ
jgi:hypothetical protein